MKFRIGLFCIFVVYFYSCSIHKEFTYYKEMPLENEQIKPIQLNGIYLNYIADSLDELWEYVYFYEDGIYFWEHTSSDNTDSLTRLAPESYVSSLRKRLAEFTPKTPWGHYKVRGDSIYIQYFFRFYQSTVKRNMFEMRGRIRNDSTIIFTEIRCTWCYGGLPKRYFFGYDYTGIKRYKAEYRFYPTSFKPDSSLAWFRKKKWYQNELHDNRKQ